MEERSLLHIGEVATLLGVTRKTIRHYHKLGLLEEPERSEGGYRLYSADDLFLLQRIRQLQGIGFWLERIKTLLDSDAADALLREALESLRDEIAGEMAKLQARQARVEALLEQEITLQRVSTSKGVSPVYQIYMEMFGDLMQELPPEEAEQEQQLWASLDSFQWPAFYHDVLRDWLTELAKRPEIKEYVRAFNQRYAALAALDPDDPEVRRLAEEVVEKQLFLKLDEQTLPMPEPFLNVFQTMINQLTMGNATPAQQRFVETIREIVACEKQPEKLPY